MRPSQPIRQSGFCKSLPWCYFIFKWQKNQKRKLDVGHQQSPTWGGGHHASSPTVWCIQASKPATRTCAVRAVSLFKKQILQTVTGVRRLSNITKVKLHSFSLCDLSSSHRTMRGSGRGGWGGRSSVLLITSHCIY